MMYLYQANEIFKAYSLFHYIEDSVSKQRSLNFVYEALATGRLRPNVDKVFPMADLKQAWEYLRAPRKSHGKVMIRV